MIRYSTAKDLEIIRAWLSVSRNSFLNNWDLIERSHSQKRLLVFIDSQSGQAVAFQMGGLTTPGIMEVREDMRGKGIGRALVGHRVTEALKNDALILFVECNPDSSIPFWKRMGFKMAPTNTKNYAYRILKKPLTLPDRGKPIEVIIKAFPEDRWGKRASRPLLKESPKAVITSDKVVHFDERISIPSKPIMDDLIIKIEVEGVRKFESKGSCFWCEEFGIKSCDNGYFIDSFHLND